MELSVSEFFLLLFSFQTEVCISILHKHSIIYTLGFFFIDFQITIISIHCTKLNIMKMCADEWIYQPRPIITSYLGWIHVECTFIMWYMFVCGKLFEAHTFLPSSNVCDPSNDHWGHRGLVLSIFTVNLWGLAMLNQFLIGCCSCLYTGWLWLISVDLFWFHSLEQITLLLSVGLLHLTLILTEYVIKQDKQ